MKKIFYLLALTAAIVLNASEGWDIDASRQPRPALDPFWQGELSVVEYCDGAKGKVERSGDIMKITKSNDEGYILIRTAEPVKFPLGKTLQLVIPMRTSDAAPDYSLGMVRLLKNLKDLSYNKAADVRSSAGPAMQFMFNQPEKMWTRRLAHANSNKKCSSYYPAIIIGGKHSTSYWKNAAVEDYHAAEKRFRSGIRPVQSYAQDMIVEKEFDRMIADSPDHTAKVAMHNGAPTLFVDGKPCVPALYKAKVASSEPTFHAGKSFMSANVDIHVIAIRYANFVNKFHNRYGVWTKDNFDIDAAITMIKNSMRTAPDAKYVLTLIVHPAYPEFGYEHPDEVWINGKGQTVYGHYTHAQYNLNPVIPARYVPWPSYNSTVWRSMVKKHTAALIAELKKQGLSKKIIGIHLAGGHDAQFSLRHTDYSKPAHAAFKTFLRERYKTVDALRKAWRDPEVTFDNAQMPVYRNKARDVLLDPETERQQIDFFQFSKHAPFRMLEDLGRSVREYMGKDIVLMRWCMAAFAGTFGAAMDIGAFMDSNVFDVLIAQSSYNRRYPGLPHGVRQPLTSYRLNGKLYLQELDLRTWLGSTSNETELRTLSNGVAQDISMWYSINRKVVGQMVAEKLGYWYYDMAGGWYDAPELLADIRSQIATEQELRSKPPRKWQASAAFVVDEEGLFLRNFPGNYYMYDAENLIAQQNQILASCATPYDFILLQDLLKFPERAKNYRTIIFAGMNHIDSSRLILLKKLQNSNRTLVFLSGTGRSGGCKEGTGFDVSALPPPQRERITTATTGNDVNQLNFADLKRQSTQLGLEPAYYYSPWRMIIKRTPGMLVPAVYRHDNAPAAAEIKFPSWRSIYIAEAGGLTPEYFHEIVRTSGGYNVSRPGIQTDMNGNFLSIHGIVGGKYTIQLPFKATVKNLKTGKTVIKGRDSFELDVKAGSTYWFGF